MGMLFRMLYLFGSVLAIGFVLWLSFTFFFAIIAIGVVLAALMGTYRFLLVKGIINPRPGVPMDESGPFSQTKPTTIDTDFKKLD